MAIQIDITLHGNDIARALLSDPEEFYYALQAIVEDEDPKNLRDLGHDVAQYANGKAEEVAAFLRILADKIESERAGA